MANQPRIAIVGGGPAGLTMAVLLHRKRIPFTVFELRPKPSEEDLALPSGMLDLHEGSGLKAIRDCGLYDEFLPYTGECSQVSIISNRLGGVIYTTSGRSGRTARPEISRNNLTKLMLTHIPDDAVKWNHKVILASKQSVATELTFGNGSKATYDLVVGADGAWSKVRELLTNVKPYYTDMEFATLTIRNITTKYPHLAELVGSGSFVSLGRRHGVVSQRGTVDSARLYLWLGMEDKDASITAGLGDAPASDAKEKLLTHPQLLGQFGPIIKELVGAACDEETADHPGENLELRSLHSLPHGSTWEHQAGVTIVGDAAHLMLPNGEGVNAAMLDVVNLSEAIIASYEESPSDARVFLEKLRPRQEVFEKDMWTRAVMMGNDTDSLIGTMFGNDDAAYTMAEMFTRLMEKAAGQV